jgi:hypothetical protein
MLYSFSICASSINFDYGETSTVFNRFAIENTSDNRVSLQTKDSLRSFRISGLYDHGGNQIYFLYAPLETSYKFNPGNSFMFNKEDFSSGADTEVFYKFNSYRLGYLWKWRNQSLNYWVGAVVKVRDAEIKVTQGSKSSSFDNIGLVPLASIGLEYFLLSDVSLFSHTDALSASQGSAYDSQIEFRYKVDSVSLAIGKRILGGGADNHRVYNFAQFDTNYIGIRLSF